MSGCHSKMSPLHFATEQMYPLILPLMLTGTRGKGKDNRTVRTDFRAERSEQPSKGG